MARCHYWTPLPVRIQNLHWVEKTDHKVKWLKVPYHTFCNSMVANPNLSILHTFGCLEFVLNQALQSERKPNKLLASSSMGMYLVLSPNHAQSVHRILSSQKGKSHCSPFLFWQQVQTIKDKVNMPLSRWQVKTGLVTGIVTGEPLDVTINPIHNLAKVSCNPWSRIRVWQLHKKESVGVELATEGKDEDQ